MMTKAVANGLCNCPLHGPWAMGVAITMWPWPIPWAMGDKAVAICAPSRSNRHMHATTYSVMSIRRAYRPQPVALLLLLLVLLLLLILLHERPTDNIDRAPEASVGNATNHSQVSQLIIINLAFCQHSTVTSSRCYIQT